MILRAVPLVHIWHGPLIFMNPLSPMRQKIVLLLLLAVSVNSLAGVRSEIQKRLIAEKMLLKSGTRAANGTNKLRTIKSNDMLSVIGHETKGYVIVTNDDQFPSVIGYSDEPFSTLPPAVEWFLTSANQAMQAVAAGEARYAPIPPTAEFPESVAPLLTSTWDQGNPYNKFCPGGNGNNSRLFPTGCVATALAQIMYYHKYPEVGIGEHQYSFKPASGDGRILSANFGATHYDWDNMLDSYSSGYTEEQADAVATLMLHCGVAVDMMYTASGSGAYGQETCLALKNYFGYNKNVRIYSRNFFTAELWMHMIFKELSLKRPIYYSGATERNGGHAFVIDGYDANGMVHVNWGWGGSSNGFFDIALLNPAGSGYTKEQQMILGICDSTVVFPYESQVLASELAFNFYGTSTKRVTISGKIYNGAVEKFDGRIACVLENSDTTIILKSTDIQLTPIVGGKWYLTSLSLPSNNLSNIPDGVYRLFVGSLTEDDTRWQLVRTPEDVVSSFVITKQGDDVTWEESVSDLWTDITPTRQTTTTNTCVYDLQGRKVKSPGKGVFIRNGKKVVY